MKFWAAIALFLVSALASADGKLYGSRNVTPGIPYQRALLVFDGRREILLVQSQKDSRSAAPGAEPVGWVVPVPAVPEIGSLESAAAKAVFETLRVEGLTRSTGFLGVLLALSACFLSYRFGRHVLADRRSGTFGNPSMRIKYAVFLALYLPNVVFLALYRPGAYVSPDTGSLILEAFLYVQLVVFGAAVLAIIFVRKMRQIEWARQTCRLAFWGSLFWMLATAAAIPRWPPVDRHPSGSPPAAAPSLPPPVAVLKQQMVGRIEVKVIAATASGGAADVIAWLKANGFRYDSADAEAFADYIGKRWVFVAARVLPSLAGSGSDGLMPSLVLKFPTATAVYPLALTATIGEATMVDLHVISPYPMAASGRMSLTHADRLRLIASPGELLSAVQPAALLAGEEWTEIYLTQFEQRMRAESMRDDLLLEKDEDDRRYGWR